MVSHSCLARRVLVLAAAVGICALATPVQAQQEPQGGLVLRVGPAIPTGGTEDDVEVIGGLELELEPGQGNVFGGAQTSISLDWISISSRSGSHSLVPILFNQKWWTRAGSRSALYWGVGAGFRFASDDIPEMDLDHEFNFAWQLLVGKPIGKNLRLDVRFIAGEDPGRDGLVVGQLGFRF